MSSLALAGPPMVVDDPGTAAPRGWEIIAATEGVRTNEGSKVYALPLLDVSFGVAPTLELSASLPYVFADPAGAGSKSDFGNAALGFKWRFVDAERFRIAMAPSYSFGLSRGDATAGIGDRSDSVFLPVNAEVAMAGRWTLNGEVGYLAFDDNKDQWFYGLAVGHPVGRRTQLMVDFHGWVEHGGDDDFLGFRFGADVALSSAWHLLAAVGSGLREPSGAEETDYEWYFGIQHLR